MFSYYGSKSKVVHLYPKPKFGKIIEPFAGSARYSLKYFDRDVLLVDKYDAVIRVWKWLQQASVKDVMSLPKLTVGMNIRELSISEDEKLLLGFLCGIGRGRPAYKVSPFAAVHFSEIGRRNKYEKIAEQLYKIRHWQIIQGNYNQIVNFEATWFIDPPYQKAGASQYQHNSKRIDFTMLAAWSLDRRGQVIVCENAGADWLPFQTLAKMHGNSKMSTEAVWVQP
jgi:site-specific DNA-adenine methylase